MVNLEPSRRSASLRLCFKNERVKTVEQWGKLYPAFTLAIAETALEMAKLGYGFRAVRMSPGASDNWLLGWMLVITSPTKYGAAEWQSTVLLDPDGNMWLQNFAPDERDLCSPSVQLIRINRFKAGDWNRWLENVLERSKGVEDAQFAEWIQIATQRKMDCWRGRVGTVSLAATRLRLAELSPSPPSLRP